MKINEKITKNNAFIGSLFEPSKEKSMNLSKYIQQQHCQQNKMYVLIHLQNSDRFSKKNKKQINVNLTLTLILFIQYHKSVKQGIWTTVPDEKCPLLVRVRVRVRVAGQLFSGAIVLEPALTYSCYFKNILKM